MKRHSFAVLTLLVTSSVLFAETRAYRAARLWPGDGPAIANAVLVVRDGKILAVGGQGDVTIPADAKVVNLGDAVVMPGLIAGETSLVERARDDLHSLTPHYRAIDGFDWYGDFSNALAGGVTTVQISPGARRLLPGQGAVVKLRGDDLDRRTLKAEESLRVVLGDASRGAPRIYEPPVGPVSVDRPLDPTRPQLGGTAANALAGLRAALLAARTAREDPDPLVRALANTWEGGRPLRVSAPGAADLNAVLGLAREFDLRLVLVAPPVARDKLASWKTQVTGVVLGAGVRPGQVTDDSAAVPAQAAKDLRAAGIPAALKPVADADLKDFLYLGSLFTTHLEPGDALRMLTADAAKVLGVADRVGTLAAEKDADFVVLTGEPFAMHTRVKEVYVDGEPAWSMKPAATRTVLRAGRILTGTGECIDHGALLLEGSTIRAVGQRIALPADAEEKNYPNAVIVPGFIDLGAKLGFGGPLSGPIAFNARLGERLARGDAGMKAARQGGVTTVLLAGQAPSSVLAFKLTDQPRVVKEPAALHFAVRGNLTSAGASLRETLRTGKAYADSWTKYAADVAAYEIKKKEFDAAQAKAPPPAKEQEKGEGEEKQAKPDEKKEEKKPEAPKAPEKPQVNDALEPYRELFAGKLPALVEARREDAIRLAVAICRDEFNVRTILMGADDAHRLADFLDSKSVAVVAGPELVRTVDRDEVNLPLTLTLRGVSCAFQSQATRGSGKLPLAVGYCVRLGLGADDALRGLTATPADILGLNGLGKLAVGRDADLVVLSGMPFEPTTRVLAVMIDGQWVHQGQE